ncbi:MAG TPA: hypothetical protein DCY59_11755 [Micrococcaceae bacterium]|nr:hypothetical protein [Micrococcaceae bacterium]
MAVSSPSRPSQKSRKVKALLAGGLVLGIGTAVTLAAWTDQEWVGGTFNSGSFNVQGTTDGTEYFEHETSGAAADLTVELAGADNLSPETTIAMPYAMRIGAGTTYNATVTLTSSAGEGTAEGALTYQILSIADFATCDNDVTGTEIIPAGTALDAVAGTASFNLAMGTEAVAGTPVNLCFLVTADNTLTEGATATAQWNFTTTSVG